MRGLCCFADFRTRLDAARDRAAGLTGKAVQPIGSSAIGRPARYSPDIARAIARRHAAGEQLCDIAQTVGVAYGTILNGQGLHPEFRDMILITQPDGRLTVNTARVRRDQQRAAMRMKLAERYHPEAYGKVIMGEGDETA